MNERATPIDGATNSHRRRETFDGPRTPDADWAMLVDALRGERKTLARRVSEALRTRLPSYRSVPLGVLDAEVELAVDRALGSVHPGRATVDDEDLVELAAIGETRARQGVGIDDLLRGWRIGVEVLVRCARETAQDLGIDGVQVLEFVQSMLAWSDTAMIATASAHRRVERALASAADEDRERFVRTTLLGAVSTAELRIHAEIYGLDPVGEYVAIRARLGEGVSRRQLEQALGFRDGTQHPRGLCALVDGDLAGFLIEPPPSNIDAVVGFGPPRPLQRLTESYRLAARALVTAEACTLRGSHDIASLGLRSAVAMDADVGELLRRRYLEPLTAGGSADDLIATLRAYLACGMRVESTATRIFVHQNTVRYRLARFEELTGASLRDTEVLIELWWALELSAMRM
ncbi:PucR family transcriptional regulator [Mycobacterium sp. pUA109]|uniref:PucR family transcriptional regulator n=1 Tax=Mycobacterium sp. pUA109 TaxID=3238982 RepID=UPI00351AEE11